GKAVSAQTERLHRQEHTKRVHSINTKQEEIRELILSTSQSFNVSISSSKDLILLFTASNIEQRTEQEIEHKAEHKEIKHEAEYEEIEHEAEKEIDNK
ncbi:13090_t:CDS:1, partial [Cetraspora pellucida]